MIHCGKIPTAGNVKVLYKGTERFNVVFQQYPLTYVLSNERRNKYISEKDLSKYTRLIARKVGSKLTPKLYHEALAAGTVEWRTVKDKEILYYTVSGNAVTTNRIEEGLKTGIYVWLMGKGRQAVLAHAVNKMLDKTQGADGRVIANPKAAGTPNIKPINGQDFWSGGEHQQWARMKLKEQLMEYFTPRIRAQLPEEIWPPNGMYIQLEYIFYTNLDEALIIGNKVQDIDNHSYPYMKIFKDTLQHLGVIKNDDPRYIRGGYPHYIHVNGEEERRLEVKVHFCRNNQPIQRPVYESQEYNADSANDIF